MANDKEIAFPKLTAEQIDALRPLGRTRDVTAGEVIFKEGDRGIDFSVVLEGEVEILEHSRGVPHTVTIHGPGEFVGDIDLLTGRATLVTARVLKAGRILEVHPPSLLRAVAELPEVGELLLKAFLMRRTLLLDDGYEGFKLIGSRFSPAAHELRDFAGRNGIPFTWVDLERDQGAEEILRNFGVPPSATPVVICRGGNLIRNPSVAQLARHIGLEARVDPGEVFDFIVVGAGPGGLAASVYAASEGLHTIMLDSMAPGGQAGTSSRIENYLGFPAGISGAELTRNALLQAQKFGAKISVPCKAVGLRSEVGRRIVVLDNGSEIVGRCVLVASGAEYRRPDIPRLAEFEGAGVYYAATDVEARICKGDEVAISGGGNSAGQAAVYLSRFASRVHLIVRSGDLGKSMSRYLVDRVEGTRDIQVHLRHVVVSLEGKKELEALRIREGEGGAETTIPARTLFIFFGAMPHTRWLSDCVSLDRKGFVLTGPAIPPEAAKTEEWTTAGRPPFFLETSMPGIFAAGDVRSGSIKRVASAVGEGAMAVSFVHSFLGPPAAGVLRGPSPALAVPAGA